MAILAAELLTYRSTVQNDTSSNGGRLTATAIADAVKNNLWPDVPEAERIAGSTKYRKTFIKVDNADDLALQNPLIFVETHSPGDDNITIFEGTQRDTQNDISSPRLYGAGDLDANVTAEDPTIDVLVEDPDLDIFQDGDMIRISDKDSVTGEGNEEYLTLAAEYAVSYLGNVATLTLAVGQEPVNSYTAAATRVASVIQASDVQTSIDNVVVTSGAGTFDETDVVLNNLGTIEQTWTATFSDATNYTIAGDVVGSVGSGVVGSTFAPNNADFDEPYFSIPAAAWGGTFSGGNTVVFQTHPAAVPIWQQRVVPAAAGSLAANKVIVAITGESA